MAQFSKDVSFFEELETATRPVSTRSQQRASRELQQLFDRMKAGSGQDLRGLSLHRSFETQPIGERS